MGTMSKKSFKDINPATAFISSAKQLPESGNTHNAYNTDNTNNKHNTYKSGETKSKRLNLLIRPSLLENFTKAAHMKRSSVNDLLNQIMADYVEQEAEAIKLYNKTFESE
jgi:predicted HicB family RNase H-like nuclease